MNRIGLFSLLAVVVLGAAAYWYFGGIARLSESPAPSMSEAAPPAQPAPQSEVHSEPSDASPERADGADDKASTPVPASPSPPDGTTPPPAEMAEGAPPPVPLDTPSGGGASPPPAPPTPPPPLGPRKTSRDASGGIGDSDRESNRGRSTTAPAPPVADLAPPNATVPSTSPSQDIPIFPYPVPKASATQILPRQLLVGSIAQPTFGTVAEKLAHALDRAGYGQSSFYALAGGHGIAIATQLEQINDDGSPKNGDGRFQLNLAPLAATEFSLSNYLRALFTARSGRFRVIVFTLSSGVTQDSRAPSEAAAITWAGSGQTRLPTRFASIPFTDQMTCTALIYEFEKMDYNADAKFIDPGKVNAMAHLMKAGIWSLLGR
jgi:hypothetical protein